MHAKRLVLLLVLPVVGNVACGGGNNSGDTGPSPVINAEAGAPDVWRAADASHDQAAPDAAVCTQLSSAARAQVQSYIQSVSSLACQVDSDCSSFYPNSPACFFTCGGEAVKTADVYAVIDGTASVCDAYFGAGCPAIKPPPCPYSRAFCDHGTCATGGGPGGLSSTIDAAVDGGAGDVPIDGGNTMEANGPG